MFSTTVSVLLGLTGVALLFHRVGMFAALRFVNRKRSTQLPDSLPAVTLLKPIKGPEDGLEDNLRSFFEQVYPGPLQIVFCSIDPQDPGIAIARAVAARFPQVEAAFVVSRDDFGLNPKVSNMRGG